MASRTRITGKIADKIVAVIEAGLRPEEMDLQDHRQDRMIIDLPTIELTSAEMERAVEELFRE